MVQDEILVMKAPRRYASPGGLKRRRAESLLQGRPFWAKNRYVTFFF
jgi:hypothetical protein